MRYVRSIILSLALGFFAGCGNSDRAGIEVGNPPNASYAFSARFIVDYGVVDYSSLGVLGKLPGADETLVIDNFRLNLTRLAAYSSYYVYVNFDIVEGLQLWPSTDITDSTQVMVSFNDESSVDTSFNEIFGNVQLDNAGLLKEIGISLKPVGNDSATITGTL